MDTSIRYQVRSETQMDAPWVCEGGIQLTQWTAKATQVLLSCTASVSRGFSGPGEALAHSLTTL